MGLYGSEKKARRRQAIFCGTPRSARGRSAVAIAEFGTYDYKNYSRHKRGSPQRQCVRDSASWVAKEGADTEKCLKESRCPRFYRVFGYYRDMADSRNKGAAFERDICKRLNAFFEQSGLETRVKRNLDQYQTSKLCDIEIPGYAIECKAYKSGRWFLSDWWEQACEAANDRVPALIWKFNNQPIRVALPIQALRPDLPGEVTIVVSFDDWLDILRDTWLPEQQVAA